MLSCLQLLSGCLQKGFGCPRLLKSRALNTVTSMPQALLEAEGKGDTWKVLGLQAAPHLIGVDGKVRVPIAGKISFAAARGTRSTCSNRRLPRQQPGQLRAPTGHLSAPQSAAKPCDTKKARTAASSTYPAGAVVPLPACLLPTILCTAQMDPSCSFHLCW